MDSGAPARDAPPIEFAWQAVIFDLDGTLIATDRYWPQAAEEGAARAFKELGIRRQVPTAEQWMSLVGGELEAGVARLLPDLDAAARHHVLQRCVEAEHAYLAQGRAAFLPGVESTLECLHAAGLRIGIASNCSARYLDQIVGDLGLARWIDEARCLHSPRVRDKSDMIEDLLAVFDTRRALMVGDREGDRDAAWANGLPHIHVADGYAIAGEHVAAQGVLASMADLPELLGKRAADLRTLLQELVPELLDRRGITLGISGDLCAGKTLLAKDLAQLAGREVERIELESVRVAPDRRAEDPLSQAYDLAALQQRLAQPSGSSLRILEGAMLLDPRLRSLCDVHLYLELPESLSLQRVRGRDARHNLAALEFATDVLLPWQARWNEEHRPADLAHCTLSGANPLRPLERT